MTRASPWFGNPDWWAILLSVVAVVVSLGTCHQVDRQLDLTKGQVRAYVQVEDVSLVEPIAEASFIRLRLRVKNFGQTAAINVHGDMDYDLGMPGDGQGNPATQRDFGSMGPGMERD